MRVARPRRSRRNPNPNPNTNCNPDPNPNTVGFRDCTQGGKCIYKFAKCRKCGNRESKGVRAQTARARKDRPNHNHDMQRVTAAEIEAEIQKIKEAIGEGRFEDAPRLPELQARLEFRQQNMLAKEVDVDTDYSQTQTATNKSALNSPLTVSELSP